MDYAARSVRALLGATAHPGGTALTRHLLDGLCPPTGAVVLDVACGAGQTLGLLAGRGLLVLGVDVEARSATRARRRGAAVVADAHALPVGDGTVDVVICECSVSTFHDPAQAVTEMARVLRPGGQLALTDVVLHRELAAQEVVDAVDRLTSARTIPAYAGLLTTAGLRVVTTEDRGADALAFMRRLRRRLPLSSTLRACERAVRSGVLGYAIITAQKA